MKQKNKLFFNAIIILLVLLISTVNVTAAVGEYSAGAFLNITGKNVSSVLADTNALGGEKLRFNESVNQSVNGTAIWTNLTDPVAIRKNVTRLQIRDDWAKWETETITPAEHPSVNVTYNRIVNSPAFGQTVIFSRNSANRLFMTVYNQTTPIFAKNVTLSSHTGGGINFDMAVENLTGDVLLVWGNTTANGWINYLVWNGTAISDNSSYRLTPGAISFLNVRLASKPNSNEVLGAFKTANSVGTPTGPDLHAAVWNGGSWTNAISLDNGTDDPGTEGMDVAYEQVSGDGLIAWGNFSNQPPAYVTYSGGTWGTPSLSVVPNTSGSIDWVRLAPKLGNTTAGPTDEIMMAYGVDTGSATSYDVYALRWSGTAWDGAAAQIELSGEGGTRTSTRNFDVIGDTSSDGFVVLETPNGQDYPKVWRCLNVSACSSGLSSRWEQYNNLFSLTSSDSAWQHVYASPALPGSFVVYSKTQGTIHFFGNFSCGSSVGTCSGTGGNLASRGFEITSPQRSYGFAFDNYGLLYSSTLFNSTSTSALDGSTINYINITVTVNHTYPNSTYNMTVYNWSGSKWNSCNPSALYTTHANKLTNFTCTICFSGCNINSDPSNFRATTGGNSNNVVMFYLNKTDPSRGHPMTYNGTFEIDYIDLFIDYTAGASLGFVLFVLGTSNTTATADTPPSAPASPNINVTCTTNGVSGCSQSNVNPCNMQGSPVCQDNSNSIYRIYNTGASSFNWEMALNTSLPSGIIFKCKGDNDPSGSTQLSTSYQTIVSSIAAGAHQDVWCWGVFSGTPGRPAPLPILNQHQSA